MLERKQQLRCEERRIALGWRHQRARRVLWCKGQERDRNEWSTAIWGGLRAVPQGPNAFSLADPAYTEATLAGAGFADVGFTDVHEPVYYGPDPQTAFDAVLRLLKFDELLADLEPAAADRARTRLRTTLKAHHTDEGVYFDSRAWIVTARHAG
jgi:hypothetical protein